MGNTDMLGEAKVIYHHLRTNILIQWSWGFHSPKTIAYGLKFCVRGLAFQGEVRIRYDRLNNRYVVMFFNERGEQVRKVWNVPLAELIDLLDRNIDGVDGDFWSEFKKQYVLNQVKR